MHTYVSYKNCAETTCYNIWLKRNDESSNANRVTIISDI